MLLCDLYKLSLDLVDEHEEALDAVKALLIQQLELIVCLAPDVYLGGIELYQVIRTHHRWLAVLVDLCNLVANFSQPLVHELAVVVDR